MTFLIAFLAFAAGIVLGAAAAWYRLRAPAVEATTAVPASAPMPAPAPAPAPAPPPAVEVAAPEQPEQPGDEDLRPVLEATRGVVSALEQRYQGARADGDDAGEARGAPGKAPGRKARAPRRRT